MFPVSSFYLNQLPAQMGSLLGSSLALQYLDCVQDESALLRLNFWLGYALHEGKRGGEAATKPLWHLLSGRGIQSKDLGLNLNTSHAWHIKGILSEKGWKETAYFIIPLTFLLTKYLFLLFSKEFLFCSDGGASHNSEEVLQFLNTLLSTQHFLQVSLTFQARG